MNRKLGEHEYLCTLGLPTHEIVPIVLNLLDRTVGSSLTCFVWANEQGEAENSYILEDGWDECASLYAQEFYNGREAEVGPTFTQMIRNKIDLVNFSRLGSTMFNSALHAELLTDFGLHHLTRVLVRDGDKCHGMFAFARARKEPSHSEHEERTLLRAARSLAHAFELESAAKLIQSDLVDNSDTGIIILDSAGSLRDGSDLGLHLFHEATRADGLNHQHANTRHELPVILARQSQEYCTSKEVIIDNKRGKFVFKPFLMRDSNAKGGAQIVVTIQRRGSLATWLWHESEKFDLSGRERQIAVLLGIGKTYGEIASQLDISSNTVDCYVRRTYRKLGINQREQVVHAVLSNNH